MSLKKLVDSLPDGKEERGTVPWHEAMQRDNPDQYQEVVDLVADWKSGGVSKRKFKTLSAMHRFLCGRDDHKLDPPVISCSLNCWFRFVKELEG